MSDKTRPGAGQATRQRARERAKEPFISQGDRPEVRLNPDAPIGELRVRDLVSILGNLTPKAVHFEVRHKHIFDKPFHDAGKGIKEGKPEKHEKIEIAELKNEPLEGNPVVEPQDPQPDPRIDRLIEAVAGLTKQVGQLANQVQEVQKRSK